MGRPRVRGYTNVLKRIRRMAYWSRGARGPDELDTGDADRALGPCGLQGDVRLLLLASRRAVRRESRVRARLDRNRFPKIVLD